jgi:DNA-binding SARP family transcriptional activator
MVELRAHLLGPFRAYLGERLLEGGAWRSQQVRTILKILLVRRGRVVTADQLIEQLWPDEDPETARRHLHVRVSQLRRILDPDRCSPVVLTVGDGYTLDPSSCQVDAAEFEALAEQARGAMEDGRWAPAIEAYEAAHALYRGDLLEEDLYQDWVYGERERLRERHLMVLTELAECYAQQGRYRRAIACCHQVLAADRCREAAYARLMLYHYYAGEQAQALRSYERCRHVLAAELGVEPLPATADLAEKIRAGTLWSHEGAPRYPPPAYEGRLFEVPYSLGHAPLVGRQREYAWLIERWRAMGGGALLLEGEAGVGKTRLADEFLGYATRTGATALRLRAASGRDLPYASITHALRRLPEPAGVAATGGRGGARAHPRGL